MCSVSHNCRLVLRCHDEPRGLILHHFSNNSRHQRPMPFQATRKYPGSTIGKNLRGPLQVHLSAPQCFLCSTQTGL